MFKRLVPLALVLGLLCVLAAVGLNACGKAEVGDLLDKGIQQVSENVEDAAGKVQKTVTEKINQASDDVHEKLDLAGSIELTTDPPLVTKACYVTFLTSNSGRPSVLQLSSYRSPDEEAFPSMFLQANVSASTLGELNGQTVPVQLFAQAVQDGPVWFSDQASPLQLRITGIAERTMTAELVDGSLRSSEADGSVSVNGKLEGVLP